MSILNNLLGMDENTDISEQDLAMDLENDSKSGITALSVAAVEALNPQLRQLYKNQLDIAINQHFELTDMLIKKGWDPAFSKPEDQLKTSYQNSQNLTQQ